MSGLFRRSLSRRDLLRGAATLAAGSLLAACMPQQAKPEATQPPQPTAAPVATEVPLPTPEATAPAASVEGAKGKVTVWGWPAADKAYESFMPDFRKTYPDIEPDIQMVPEEHDKLLATLAAGAGAPDVGMIEINQIDKFVVKGGLEDLLTDPYLAGVYKKDMVEYKWQQGTSPDGRLVAFPWDIGPATFFYRRDLFEEAGLPSDPAEVAKLTNTWPGFLDVCKRLTKPDKQRWALSNASTIVYTSYAHRNFFDEKWDVAIDKGAAVQLLKYAQEARKAGVDAKVAEWSAEWQTLLGQGGIAIQYGGCWMGGFIKGWLKPEGVDWNGKWGIFEVPEDPGQNWGGSFLCIPKVAANKMGAWAFIQYALATASAQNKMFLAVDYFPAYKPAFTDPLYHEPDPFYGNQKTREMWVDIAMNKIKPFVTTPMDAQAEQIFMAAVGEAIEQNLNPQETLTKAAQDIATQTAQDKDAALKLKGGQ